MPAAAYCTTHTAEDRRDRSDCQHDDSNGREHGETLHEQSNDQKHYSENDHLGFLSLHLDGRSIERRRSYTPYRRFHPSADPNTAGRNH